jgi:hypothetical protein
MLKKTLETYGRLKGDPADVFRSDVVSVSSKATVATMELFAVPVGFGDVAAVWAGSACVFRFNIDYWNPCNLGFVFDKVLELVESPRVDCSSLATTFNRYPQSNAFEVLKSYSSEGVLSLLNNPFGDCMVDCGCEPVFLSTSFLEQTLSRSRSFTLEFASDFDIDLLFR